MERQLANSKIGHAESSIEQTPAVGNRYEFLDVVDEHGAPTERPRSRAGQYIPYPVSRSLERRCGPAARC